jgi:hypothetical protein
VAVLFNRGGDDGYWMRILGNENFSDRRVGALVVTPSEIAYAELCAFGPRPRTKGRMLLTMARGGDKALGFYKWTATSSEIDTLTVTPVWHSAHGAFATLEIGARGQAMTFGLYAADTVQKFVSAVRHVARAEHDVGMPSHGEPRVDGVYLFCAKKPSHRFDAVTFDGEQAYYLSLGDVAKSMGEIASGEWKPQGCACRTDGGYTVIASEDADWERRAIVLSDGRLVLQARHWLSTPDAYGNNTQEFAFVPDSELRDGWGKPTIPGPLPASDWPPILSPGGDLVAADIGRPTARVKG